MISTHLLCLYYIKKVKVTSQVSHCACRLFISRGIELVALVAYQLLVTCACSLNWTDKNQTYKRGIRSRIKHVRSGPQIKSVSEYSRSGTIIFFPSSFWAWKEWHKCKKNNSRKERKKIHILYGQFFFFSKLQTQK